MNYLAHAYLSFNEPELTAGNMIADFVKGRRLLDYSPGIQRGIRLHREIDQFTDHHAATAEAKSFFRPSCGLYSGIFTDVVYDHFLANDPNYFPAGELLPFTLGIFRTLRKQEALLPDRFLQMLHYMETQNWMYDYRLKSGIEQSFTGMVRRTKYMPVPASVPYAVFETHYDALRACYAIFFPALLAHVRAFMAEAD
ncbi:DUF479 domain-containing protein [Chitinophaga pendula]|uniref:acyl carrier protein phosphodiesterase n=1 Tax=Chitinophaga TaxID=79328 RepID=UPI0012FD8156|nr:MULTISPECIES: ACP phosphodiesterase [Chitinophaga]UCJ06959.1 DUF479 domain-containing protein [Chitinophaga pendula]